VETIEAIGLVVAIVTGLYSAILSSILALRETRRERRKVRARIEYDFRQGHYNLVIVNLGFRPVTLTGASLSTLVSNGDEHWFPVEYDFLFASTETDPFPVTLGDGDHLRVRVNESLTPEWFEQHRVRFQVYDAERNAYRVDTTHVYRLGYDPGV
jgi:hypothetical protein